MTESTVETSKESGSILVETPIRVLNVDDDFGFLKITKQILEVLDVFQVDTALSADEAMEKMKKTTYDAIVSDHQMTGKDGLDFLKELRDSGNDVPFILFTGKGRESIAIQALNLGVDQYFNKLGDPETVYCELAHGIRQAVETNRAKAERDKLLQMYRERVKELTCLYEISRLVEEPGISTEEILQRTTSLLSAAYQYPDVTCVKIIFEGQEFKTENFKETPWKQQTDIKLYGKRAGIVEVYYLEKPLLDEGSFTKEERDLIDAVAERLGKTAERKEMEDELISSEERLRILFESAPDAIYLNDLKGTFVDGNKAAEELTGYERSELIGKSFLKLKLLPLKQLPKAAKLLAENVLRRPTGPDEFILNRKDGTQVHVEIRTFPVKIKDQTLVLGIARDVTERKKAEEKLKESEEDYRRIVELAPDMILTVNTRGVVTSCNTALERISGYSRDEIIGKHFAKIGFIRLRDIPKYMKLFISILRGKAVDPFEAILRSKDGITRLTEVHISLMKEDGKTIGIHSICRDITERKKAEAALHESEERFRSLFESAREGIVFTGPDGRITRMNDAGASMLGYGSPEELVGIPAVELYLDPKAREALFKEIMERGYVEHYELTLKKKDGSPIHTLNSSSTRRDEDGNILQSEAFFSDITERKKAEEALRRSEEKYRSLFVNMLSGYAYCKIILDEKNKPVDFVYLEVNDAFERLTGLKKEVVLGKRVTEAIPGIEEAHPELFEIYGRVALTGEEEVFDIDFKPLDIWLHVSVYSPRKGYFVAIFENITERRKAEEALKESEEKYRVIFEGATDGILCADTKTKRFAFANPRICEITGYSSDELFRMSVAEIHPEKDLPYILDQFEKQVQGKISLATDIPVLRKDRSVVYCDVNSKTEKIGKQEYLVGFFRDITERKRMGEELQESEKRFRTISTSAKDAIILMDNEGAISYWNLEAENMFGYTKEEAIGKELHRFLSPKRFYKDFERGFAKFKETGLGAAVGKTVELAAIRRDGTEFPIELSLSALNLKGKWHATGILRDITERKKTFRKIETMNEKLEIVGGLTRHDVNNNLATVRGNVYLAKQGLTGDHQALQYLHEIESAVEQAELIFDFARVYERLGVEALEYVNVEDAVDGACKQFSDIGVEVENGCGGLRVLADSMLSRLFYNLIDNSLKHGEKVTKIRAYYEDAKDKLHLVYEDDGVGIPPVEKEKIFQQGYGKGSGLGLYLIMKICEVYGWTIKEAGKQGEGARFIMILPKANKDEGKASYKLQ